MDDITTPPPLDETTPPDVDTPLMALTCHTPGCVNEGVSIDYPATGAAACGPCGQVITDIEPTA